MLNPDFQFLAIVITNTNKNWIFSIQKYLKKLIIIEATRIKRVQFNLICFKEAPCSLKMFIRRARTFLFQKTFYHEQSLYSQVVNFINILRVCLLYQSDFIAKIFSTKPKHNQKKLRNYFLYERCTCKIMMKLTQGGY